jgi:hypothetical protein
MSREEKGDGAGWIEIFSEQGRVLVTLRGKTGWREVGRGSCAQACPVVRWRPGSGTAASRGPLFRSNFRDNKTVDVERRSDKHVALPVK